MAICLHTTWKLPRYSMAIDTKIGPWKNLAHMHEDEHSPCTRRTVMKSLMDERICEQVG
jgi:hypothetical protein